MERYYLVIMANPYGGRYGVYVIAEDMYEAMSRARSLCRGEDYTVRTVKPVDYGRRSVFGWPLLRKRR